MSVCVFIIASLTLLGTGYHTNKAKKIHEDWVDDDDDDDDHDHDHDHDDDDDDDDG